MIKQDFPLQKVFLFALNEKLHWVSCLTKYHVFGASSFKKGRDLLRLAFWTSKLEQVVNLVLPGICLFSNNTIALRSNLAGYSRRVKFLTLDMYATEKARVWMILVHWSIWCFNFPPAFPSSVHSNSPLCQSSKFQMWSSFFSFIEHKTSYWFILIDLSF